MIFGVVIVLFLAYLVARYYESGAARETMAHLHRAWKMLGVQGRVLLGLLMVMMTLYGGSKETPSPAASLYCMLFWHNTDLWQLLSASQALDAGDAAVASAEAASIEATNTAAEVEAYVASNTVATVSFSWHTPNRLPYHDRQNVMGRTVWVQPTNILGILYEDHYVAFNEVATTNPAIIQIEYARTHTNGTIERYSAATITNSFPDMVTVTLQSGTNSCYWFRCPVPPAFTNSCCVRDWNPDALFGSSEGSNKGFDMMGILVIDDGNNLWQGANTNIVMNGVTNQVRNGIIAED